MPDPRIRAVIFDLGRVLLDFDHLIAARKIAGHTKKTPEEIFNLFFDSELTRSFEEGKIGPVDFFGKVKEMLNLSLTYEEFVPIWNEIFFYTPANRSVHALAQGLRKKYRTAVLSNINILHFTYIKETFPVFGAFDNVITSYEMKATKPDPAIYTKALEIIGAKPGEVFYTDDRPELVASAQGMGIRAFVFKTIAQLESDLKKSGIELP
jgi:glucose-1-phosphatase